jgi:hypothetical protein
MLCKLKSPVATLRQHSDTIRIKDINLFQFAELFHEVQTNLNRALKRFSNPNEELNYYLIQDLFHSMKRQAMFDKKYYYLTFSIPQARCFVKHFSKYAKTNSTTEIVALLDQKLPILSSLCREPNH